MFVTIVVVSLGVVITAVVRRSLVEPLKQASPIEAMPMTSLEMTQAAAEISEEPAALDKLGNV